MMVFGRKDHSGLNSEVKIKDILFMLTRKLLI